MVIVVMGVSGCGKTTIGKLLSEKLGIPFFDGDDFHPEKNVTKMASGTPLNDEDRKPWLLDLASHIHHWNQKKGAVLACSALKKSYRQRLMSNTPPDTIIFVYLKGSKKLISNRLQERNGHYMPPELLNSQFEVLEEPQNAMTVPVHNSPETIVTTIINLIQHAE